MKTVADKIVNAALFPFGRCRVQLGDWPDYRVNEVLDTIREKGGSLVGEGGAFPGIDDYYFRLPGGGLKITVFEYGEAYLYGPKRLVRELTEPIAV